MIREVVKEKRFTLLCCAVTDTEHKEKFAAPVAQLQFINS